MLPQKSVVKTVRELRERIAECRKELLRLLEDWHYMQTVAGPRIMFTYDGIFGDLEIDYQKKDKYAVELERRVEILSIKLKNGERLTPKTLEIVDNIVEKEANSNDNKRSNSGEGFLPRSKSHENKEKEIPRVYRKIVKRLHPDLRGETEEYSKYWDNVQEAYRRRNLHRLKLFDQTLCVEDKNYPDLKSEEIALRGEIRQLEMNIAVERRKLEKLKDQEPFSFEEKLEDNIWIANRRRLLKEKIFQTEIKIQKNRRMLRSLTGSAG